MRKQESWAEGWGAALFSSEESRLEGEHSGNLTCCPLTSCPIPGISSAGEPASLLNPNVLENWNNYQVAHLRSLHAPGRGNLAGGETQSPPQPQPWEGHGAPSEKSTLPRAATSAPDPRHPSADIQTQVRSFPGQRPGQVLPRSPVLAHRTGSGLNELIIESTWSHPNISSSRQDFFCPVTLFSYMK